MLIPTMEWVPRLVQLFVPLPGLNSIFNMVVWAILRMWLILKLGRRFQLQVIDYTCCYRFADVFPKEISGVPLERQVEFRIDLALGVYQSVNFGYCTIPIGTTLDA